MSREEQIIQERLKKIEELRKQDISPYPHKFDKKQSCDECLKSKLGKEVKTAGRIIIKRDLGKISFAKIQDSTERIQIVLQEGKTPEKIMQFFKKYIDTGDFIGVEGKIIKTRTREISILVKKIDTAKFVFAQTPCFNS